MFTILYMVISVLMGLGKCECPFSRLDNPGFKCNTEVTSNSPLIDILVEKIHNNSPPATCLIDEVECDENSPYRSISGVCNNLNDPWKGVTMSLFERKLHNAYDDGVSQPRSVGKDGNPLPNPRNVSLKVNPLLESVVAGKSADHNHLLTVFGQWLGHDLAYTPIVPAVEQCKDCETTHSDCMPIKSIPGDTKFPYGCMQFTRSANGENGNGYRKQINIVSSYLDASQIYGSDVATHRAIRDLGNGGRMKTQSNGRLMPQKPPNPEGIGCSPLSTEPCFHAGDDRDINCETRAVENMGLNAMHTLFVVEHNRIADYFAAYSNWNDDQIFLKTRQLVTAMIQHIAYKEYLPVLLGEDIMNKYNLVEETGGEYFTGYNDSCDVTPVTEFATAAYRFGHSTIHYRVNYHNSSGDLVKGW